MYTNANITILCHATIFLSAGFPQLLSSLPTSHCHSALHRTASSSPSSLCAVLSGLRKIRAAVKGGVQQYLYTIHATSKYPLTLTGAGVTTGGVIDGSVSGWEVPCAHCALHRPDVPLVIICQTRSIVSAVSPIHWRLCRCLKMARRQSFDLDLLVVLCSIFEFWMNLH